MTEREVHTAFHHPKWIRPLGTAAARMQRADEVLAEVRAEVERAITKHRPMSSAHEGHAVLQEEADELWDEVKADRGYTADAMKEAIQVAAMGVRYVVTTDIMPVVKIAETGEPMADSRDVAAFFGKRHDNVLQSVRRLECSQEFRLLNFQEFKIKDLTGEYTSHALMTKDGFTFLAMGFTGERAAIFKERYIAAFNAMAARPAVPDFSDPEVLQMHLLASTKREIELKKQVKVITKQVEDAAEGASNSRSLPSHANSAGRRLRRSRRRCTPSAGRTRGQAPRRTMGRPAGWLRGGTART